MKFLSSPFSLKKSFHRYREESKEAKMKLTLFISILLFAVVNGFLNSASRLSCLKKKLMIGNEKEFPLSSSTTLSSSSSFHSTLYINERENIIGNSIIQLFKNKIKIKTTITNFKRLQTHENSNRISNKQRILPSSPFSSTTRLYALANSGSDDEIEEESDIDLDILDDDKVDSGDSIDFLSDIEGLGDDEEESDEDDDEDDEEEIEDEEDDEDAGEEEGEGEGEGVEGSSHKAPVVGDDKGESKAEESESLIAKRELDRQRKEKRKLKDAAFEKMFEDDPLRANSPTKDMEPLVDRFNKWYVAVADIESAEMLARRKEAWLHHMQWTRRNSLLPNSTAQVEFEYTQLSIDCMYPVGQVVGFRANESASILEMLHNEPLSLNGGLSKWRVYEFNPLQQHPNASSDFRVPYLFLGEGHEATPANLLHRGGKGGIEDGKEVWLEEGEEINLLSSMTEAQFKYHTSGGDERVVTIGSLLPVGESANDSSSSKKSESATKKKRVGSTGTSGTLIVFNAPTAGDAKRYIENDPSVKGKKYKTYIQSAVNVQDVNGLNHLMARSFAEQTQLNQIHFLDPEDLLLMDLPTLPTLPDHAAENHKVIEMLKELLISYKYTRFNVMERIGDDEDIELANEFNAGMDAFQSVRLQSTTELYGQSEAVMDSQESEETESYSSGDDL